jgi:hypothetical protein
VVLRGRARSTVRWTRPASGSHSSSSLRDHRSGSTSPDQSPARSSPSAALFPFPPVRKPGNSTIGAATELIARQGDLEHKDDSDRIAPGFRAPRAGAVVGRTPRYVLRQRSTPAEHTSPALVASGASPPGSPVRYVGYHAAGGGDNKPRPRVSCLVAAPVVPVRPPDPCGRIVMLTHHNPGGDARKPASAAVQLHRRWGWQMPGPMTTTARPPAPDAGRAATAAGDGTSGVTDADRLWIALTLARAGGTPGTRTNMHDAVFRFYLPMARSLARASAPVPGGPGGRRTGRRTRAHPGRARLAAPQRSGIRPGRRRRDHRPAAAGRTRTFPCLARRDHRPARRRTGAPNPPRNDQT